jgi:methionine sulfoxide reductase heme-binding subunit
MAQRNPPPSLPWAGAATLAVAAFGAGILLTGPGVLANLIHPWYLTRAAGLVAYVLLWLSVSLGLLQSTQFLKGATSPLANIDVHTFVSVGALYATTFHFVILLWDRYVPFTLTELLVPFASDYKPVLTGLGIITFYIMLGVTISTYLRSKLNAKVWRAVHQVSLVAFLLALTHGVLMGTDSGHPLVSYLYRFSGLSVGALVAYRISQGVIKRHADSARGR